MTCFLLIRHAETDSAGRVLDGRAPGVALNPQGGAQARSLAARVRVLPPALVCASPLERCRQTAAPLAAAYGLELRTLPELWELDYGDWQGQTPTALEASPDWHEYNRARSLWRIPGGELLAEVQLRMLRALEVCCREAPASIVALVSHADPLKALLAYLLGIPLDFINRFTLAPASISVVTVGRGEPCVQCVNHGGDVVVPDGWERPHDRGF